MFFETKLFLGKRMSRIWPFRIFVFFWLNMKNSRIWSIIRTNNETFYVYNKNSAKQRPLPIRKRILTFIGLSSILVYLLENINNTAIGAVITIQSILVGFSFSVLFFLLSSKISLPSKKGSIEQKSTYDRLILLGKELFYNVSYFTIIAISSLFVSLLLILPKIDGETIKFLVYAITYFETSTLDFFIFALRIIRTFISFFLEGLFFFLLFECFFTFARIIGRVNYYFEKRLKLDT